MKKDAAPENILEFKEVDYHKENKHNGLNHVSLAVRKGEILGIAGVDGNGQSQLARIAAGVLTPDSGSVYLKSEKVAKFLPKTFIDAKVAHIPEDRNKMGLVGNMTVEENLILKSTEKPRFQRAKVFF